MTDNKTTELLRLLEERGARYEKPEDDTTIYYDGDGNRYTYNVNPDSGWAQLFGYNLTPEQAIAATMSDETTLLSCPFCGGEANVIDHHNDDGSVSVGCNNDTCLGFSGLGWLYKTEAEAIAAWNTRASNHYPYEQRITGNGSDWGEIMRDAYDNLIATACESCTPEQMGQLSDYIRAELGSGTCEFVIKDNMNESEGMGDVWIECSACHCQFDYYADDWLMKMSYCPNCSARNRKAVD